jgi:hypothetical protein
MLARERRAGNEPETQAVHLGDPLLQLGALLGRQFPCRDRGDDPGSERRPECGAELLRRRTELRGDLRAS